VSRWGLGDRIWKKDVAFGRRGEVAKEGQIVIYNCRGIGRSEERKGEKSRLPLGQNKGNAYDN